MNDRASRKFDFLRHQAEELLQNQPDLGSELPSDILDLIHELKVHQAELEIQNEELKQAQGELSELHREYEDLYEFAPCAYLSINSKGIITRINLTGVKLLGNPRTLVMHSGFGPFLEPEWEDVYLAARKKSAETGEKQSIELSLKTVNGSPLWVRAEIEAQKGDSDEVIQWRMVLVDITDIRKAEAERKELEEELEQARKMEAIGTLAGGIAHEFNNVLGIILGNAELAMDDVPHWNPASESLKEIKTASIRAKEVVRQILAFARKSMLAREPFEIAVVVNECMKLMRASIPTTIDIKTNMNCESQRVLGNATEIHQVLMNLCTNAAQAMEMKTGTIHVDLSQLALDEEAAASYEGIAPGDYVRLCVEDNACGMTPETLAKIFEPYFTTKEIGQGTGMGLAVAYGIVKKSDGAIRATSEFGKGTAIEVLLPLYEGTAKSEKGSNKALVDKGKGQRILFVDDEPSMVKLFKLTLEQLGYQVTAMTDSVSALERFRSHPDQYDLVITDMSMPHMAGDQLAMELLKTRPDLPILICTGHSDHMDKDRAKQLGIKGYLSKPLERQRLAVTVARLLEG